MHTAGPLRQLPIAIHTTRPSDDYDGWKMASKT